MFYVLSFMFYRSCNRGFIGACIGLLRLGESSRLFEG